MQVICFFTLFLAYSVFAKDIHRAVEKNDIKALENLIAQGADLEAKSEEGWTALHLAAYQGKVDIIKKLVEAGADFNAITDEKKRLTPLHLTALGKQPQAASLFLDDYPADVRVDGSGNTFDFYFLSPLKRAVRLGDTKAVEELLKRKETDVNKTDGGASPLYDASFQGHTQIVEALIQAGADVNFKTSIGWTALHIASFRGYESIVTALLEAGADPEAKTDRGQTTINVARLARQNGSIERLLTCKQAFKK